MKGVISVFVFKLLFWLFLRLWLYYGYTCPLRIPRWCRNPRPIPSVYFGMTLHNYMETPGHRCRLHPYARGTPR